MGPDVRLITLGVADLAVARRFYAEGLGWAPVLDVPGEIAFFQIGHGLLLALFPVEDLDADVGSPVSRAGRGPGFTLAHNVSSEAEVDTAVGRAQAAGATVLKAPQRAAFGGYHAYLADPDGFVWEVAHNPGLTVDPDGTVRFSGTGG